MESDAESLAEGRYGTYETEDGSVVLFDDENPDAWIACDDPESVRRRD